MKAKDFLGQANKEMEDRAVFYDQPEGERSMAKTVELFNVLKGTELTEEDGWKFMQLLKLVRSEQGDFRADNYVDGSAYTSLAGEAAHDAETNGNAKKVAAAKTSRTKK